MSRARPSSHSHSPDLGEILRRWRGVAGETGPGSRGEFTQAAAARHLGIALGTYRNWEQGRFGAPSPLTIAGVMQRIRTKPAS